MPDDTASRHSMLLDGLPEEERRRIEGRLSMRSIPAGTVLLEQGTWQGLLYLIRSGVLGIHVQAASGDIRQVAKLVPGECAGEMSLLTGMPASASVVAITQTTVGVLSHMDFVELLASSPALARNVSIILSRRLATTLQREETSFYRTVRLRVHQDVPPDLPGHLAHATARYLAAPLLILDLRSEGTTGEELSLDDMLEQVRRRASGGWKDGPPVLRVGTLSAEDWARLEGDLVDEIPNVMLIAPADDKSAEAWQANLGADVVLWPPDTHAVPPTGSDVVMVREEPYRNSRAACDEEASRVGGRVIRIMAPGSARDLNWVARHLAGLKVGLTLGGGGARGSAHIGILQGLERAGVPIDYISGCSVGGGLAAGYAYGLSIPELVDMIRNFAGNILRYTMPRYSLLSNRGLRDFFRDMVGDRTIEDLDIPLAIIAADVLRAHSVVLDRGLIWKAVLASTALPGIYPPIWIGDYCLVDGGVIDPVPAFAARDLGADVVLAARLSKIGEQETVWTEAADTRQGESPSVIQTLQRSFDVMAEEISTYSVTGANVVINVESEPLTIREFRAGTKLVPAGEAALEHAWPEIQTVLPWLAPHAFPRAEP